MKGDGIVNITVLLFLTTALVFSGCASFRAGGLHPDPNWPPRYEGNGKSISLTVAGENTFNGKEQEVGFALLRSWRELVAKEYQRSGLFSEVVMGASDSDLKAEIEIIDSTRRNIGLAILTGLTLYLVPSIGTDELTVRTTLKDRGGNTLGTCEKSETITTWVQVLLVFATPFHHPGSVYEETLRDLNRSTIMELRSEGL